MCCPQFAAGRERANAEFTRQVMAGRILDLCDEVTTRSR
jgi:hypothetical protein